MRNKLFALENNNDTSDDNNDLLIDKVLQKKKEEKSPLSLTADLLKQRQELKQQITDKLETGIPDQPDNTETVVDKNEDTESKPSNDDEESEKPKDTSSKSEDTNETEDDTDVADDIESLRAAVGKGGDSDKKDSKPKPTDTATESLETSCVSGNPKLDIRNLFEPVLTRYKQYQMSLESYGLGDAAMALEAQPVVYVKEEINKSLSVLTESANTYVEKNTKFVETITGSIKDLNERIMVFGEFVKTEKYRFNQKLVNDQEVLKRISCTGKSDIRETVKVLLGFIENSSKVINLMLNNSFDQIGSSLTQAGFTKEQEDYQYKDMLPGFGFIRVHVPLYKNYANTRIDNYHYYKLINMKTEDLYDLESIAVVEDKELQFIVTALNKLLSNIALNVDNLNDVAQHFNDYVNQLKVLMVDIDQGKYKDLKSVGIDEKVKDFIRFKLTMESLFINVNTMIEYMVTVMTVLNTTVELKE